MTIYDIEVQKPNGEIVQIRYVPRTTHVNC